jgi:hypothetical protein
MLAFAASTALIVSATVLLLSGSSPAPSPPPTPPARPGPVVGQLPSLTPDAKPKARLTARAPRGALGRQDPQDRSAADARRDAQTIQPFLQQLPYEDRQVQIQFVAIADDGRAVLGLRPKQRPGEAALNHVRRLIRASGDDPPRYRLVFAGT